MLLCHLPRSVTYRACLSAVSVCEESVCICVSVCPAYLSESTLGLKPGGVHEVVQCGHRLQPVSADAVNDLVVPADTSTTSSSTEAPPKRWWCTLDCECMSQRPPFEGRLVPLPSCIRLKPGPLKGEAEGGSAQGLLGHLDVGLVPVGDTCVRASDPPASL